MDRTLIHPIGFSIDGNIVSMLGTVLERIGERTTVGKRWESKFPRFQKTFGFEGGVKGREEVSLCCVLHGWYYSDTIENGNGIFRGKLRVLYKRDCG
jgi:hypothetical protein